MVSKRILISFLLACSIAFVVLISEGIKQGHLVEALEFFAVIALGVTFFVLPIWLGKRLHLSFLNKVLLVAGVDAIGSLCAWALRDSSQSEKSYLFLKYFLCCLFLSLLAGLYFKALELYLAWTGRYKNSSKSVNIDA